MEKSLIVKDSRIYSNIVLHDMHTDFYIKALDGITDESAHNRLDTKANHVAWLAGSLVQQRYELATMFGEAHQQTHHELFSDFKGIQDGAYPPLEDFRQDWQKISPVLRQLLSDLPTEKLDSIFEAMGMKMTYFELLSFNTYREASVIGQIALWRRLLDYPAMKYD